MKIEINLNETAYHIEVEQNCFTPYRHGTTKDGKEKTEALGYCTKLSNAVNFIVRDSMATSTDTVSLIEYVERYESALNDTKALVDF